jgi:hypothetical protein
MAKKFITVDELKTHSAKHKDINQRIKLIADYVRKRDFVLGNKWIIKVWYNEALFGFTIEHMTDASASTYHDYDFPVSILCAENWEPLLLKDIHRITAEAQAKHSFNEQKEEERRTKEKIEEYHALHAELTEKGLI